MAFQEAINYGRARQCKNNMGGIKAAYLAPYRKLSRSEYIYDGSSIIEFPETVFYKFELLPGSTVDEQLETSEGGKYFSTSIKLTFNKITAFDNVQFEKLLKKDYWMIIEDNNGNFFFYGFRIGLTADSLSTTTTQYSLSFSGEETFLAPFVTNPMSGNYVFQDDINFLFQDGNNYIFQS